MNSLILKEDKRYGHYFWYRVIIFKRTDVFHEYRIMLSDSVLIDLKITGIKKKNYKNLRNGVFMSSLIIVRFIEELFTYIMK